MPSPPPWVAKGFSDILGLDTDTIREAIIPDLDNYTSEVRLRGHLVDFLGTTQPARDFIDKYIAFRFPAIPSASSSTPRVLTPDPDLIKPSKSKKKDKAGAGSGRATPSAGGVNAPLSAADLSAAFGSGGRVYQKSQPAEGLFPSRGGSASGVQRPTPGSGAHTPVPVRRGGAITITEAKVKPAAKGKGKEKEEEKIWDLPKSTEVQRLEGIVEALRNMQAGEGKAAAAMDKPPCFCQGRTHPVSTYTPQCAACGLILCDRQPAHAPCPSCARPTLSPPALARLIQRVEGDVAAQLVREEEERDRTEKERKALLLAQSGGGAFPTLPGGAAATGKPTSAADATRRVLTISKPGAGSGKGKGKNIYSGTRATLTTTTYTTAPTPSASSATPATPAPVDDTVPRPRSPPLDGKRVAKELAKARAWREDNDRPWGDPKAERRGEMWEYAAPVVVEVYNDEGTGRRRRAQQRKKAGVGMDGRVVVGAAR